MAKLIGVKVFTTELLAFQQLGQDYKNGVISVSVMDGREMGRERGRERGGTSVQNRLASYPSVYFIFNYTFIHSSIHLTINNLSAVCSMMMMIYLSIYFITGEVTFYRHIRSVWFFLCVYSGNSCWCLAEHMSTQSTTDDVTHVQGPGQRKHCLLHDCLYLRWVHYVSRNYCTSALCRTVILQQGGFNKMY